MKLNDLKAVLFSTTDGGSACDAINKLAKLAKRGSEEAQSLLAAYSQDGAIPHVRAHACGSLTETIKGPNAAFAAVFRDGLDDPHIRYWSILGYINSAGKDAYQDLIQLAEDNGLRLADRAHAIKCLSAFSKQKFDRGCPSDPGLWKEEQLRLSDVRAWAASGYSDGVEYAQPIRDPALDQPHTEFEKIVQKLDKKLAKARKKRQDLAEPTDWLVIALRQDIRRIKARWELPATYLDFLTRFSPLRVIISNRRFSNVMSLFGAGELLEGQNGYSFDPINKQPISDWPAPLVVIASHGGDPFVLDLSHSDGNDAPILTAEHGAGEWNFERVADSFAEFLEQLAR